MKDHFLEARTITITLECVEVPLSWHKSIDL
jgi:hypothetical protein